MYKYIMYNIVQLYFGEVGGKRNRKVTAVAQNGRGWTATQAKAASLALVRVKACTTAAGRLEQHSKCSQYDPQGYQSRSECAQRVRTYGKDPTC